MALGRDLVKNSWELELWLRERSTTEEGQQRWEDALLLMAMDIEAAFPSADQGWMRAVVAATDRSLSAQARAKVRSARGGPLRAGGRCAARRTRR